MQEEGSGADPQEETAILMVLGFLGFLMPYPYSTNVPQHNPKGVGYHNGHCQLNLHPPVSLLIITDHWPDLKIV